VGGKPSPKTFCIAEERLPLTPKGFSLLQGAERYETQYRKQQVSYLKRRAAQLGLQIMEATVPA
jgi:hypothetical protein